MTQQGLNTVRALPEDVAARKMEGEIIIIPLTSGIGDTEDELYTLNPTGQATCLHSSSFVRPGGELHLSNLGQLELLRATVERGVPFRTTVRGFSMAPCIRDGDVLTIAPLNGRAPRMGDVVAFTMPGSERLAIHRVIGRVGEGWLMRGDNCPEADGVISRERILGRVTRLERNGREARGSLGAQGWLIAWLQRIHVALPLNKLFGLPRLVAAALLRRAQGWAIYRALGRRVAAGVRIDEAGAEDMALVHAYFNPGKAWRSEAPDPNVTNYVAKRCGAIVGCVQLVRHPEAEPPWAGHWLFSLEVRGRYRGLGIGKKLTRRVIAQAVADGAPELSLVVFEDNARAIRLYHKLGFEQVVLPALEPQLEAEEQQSGRRRSVMRKIITSQPV